ncbi:MAG: bifunctional adenosylcobinamide kinase/adenosylcobinamide-phosphate guanylyltransferase [Firmicutes bacterium]|nr:bifunctional adenosylcobinamide kinase/adenosylcobinamide-phosphate guanylyltransferase [Bacillota bacterium]
MILVIGGAFQGKEKFARDRFKDKNIFCGFEKYMREKLKKGEKREDIFEKIKDGKYDVIISCEIGCGIVPIEKEERYIREETGRILCDIAAACEEVWRVQCGIGTKIKG